MPHPFAELIALNVDEQRAGHSRLSLVVSEDHLNPHGVVHGAVVYAMATVANLESKVLLEDRLVATANGHYAIFTPRPAAGGAA